MKNTLKTHKLSKDGYPRSIAVRKNIGDSRLALGQLHEAKEVIGKKEKDKSNNPMLREFKQDSRAMVTSHA